MIKQNPLDGEQQRFAEKNRQELLEKTRGNYEDIIKAGYKHETIMKFVRDIYTRVFDAADLKQVKEGEAMLTGINKNVSNE